MGECRHCLRTVQPAQGRTDAEAGGNAVADPGGATDDVAPAADAPTEAISLATGEDDPATATPENEPADDSDATTKVIPAAAATSPSRWRAAVM